MIFKTKSWSKYDFWRFSKQRDVFTSKFHHIFLLLVYVHSYFSVGLCKYNIMNLMFAKMFMVFYTLPLPRIVHTYMWYAVGSDWVLYEGFFYVFFFFAFHTFFCFVSASTTKVNKTLLMQFINIFFFSWIEVC